MKQYLITGVIVLVAVIIANIITPMISEKLGLDDM